MVNPPNLGNLAGGIIGLAGTVIIADIAVQGMRTIQGQILGQTRTHYHVKLHEGGRIKGHRKTRRKGEVVMVKKSSVKVQKGKRRR